MIYHIKNKKELDSILKSINIRDSIYIDSIDCLGNSVYDISKILEDMYNKELYILISNNIELDFTKDKHCLKNTIDLLIGICDLQRKRVKQSVKKARERGKNVGRKKLTPKDLPDIFISNLNDFNSKKINKVEFARICNCSRPTLDKWLKCALNGD